MNPPTTDTIFVLFIVAVILEVIGCLWPFIKIVHKSWLWPVAVGVALYVIAIGPTIIEVCAIFLWPRYALVSSAAIEGIYALLAILVVYALHCHKKLAPTSNT